MITTELSLLEELDRAEGKAEIVNGAAVILPMQYLRRQARRPWLDNAGGRSLRTRGVTNAFLFVPRFFTKPS